MLLLKPAIFGPLLFIALVGLIFPPLYLIPLVWLIVKAVRKIRDTTDTQSRAWREAQAWHQPNG